MGVNNTCLLTVLASYCIPDLSIPAAYHSIILAFVKPEEGRMVSVDLFDFQNQSTPEWAF